jgi:hypothetical protein
MKRKQMHKLVYGSLFFCAIVLAQLAAIPRAEAVVCARGMYRAGCVGPRGAVVVRRPYVHHYHRHCYWRAGVRVCR